MPAQAATLTTWDLSTGGVETGNYYQYTTQLNGITPLEIYAWSDANSGATTLRPAEVMPHAQGLGVCSPNDELQLSHKTLACEDRQGRYYGVDNLDERNWLLLYLPGEATNLWSSMNLVPYKKADMDISYWVGTINSANDLNGVDYSFLNTIGFGSRIDVTGNNINHGHGNSLPVTIDFGYAQGNAILIGAAFNDTNDGFIAASVTSAVPIPPAVWLFGSGLVGLIARARRK